MASQSFATSTTPEEAREEGWAGLARSGGARLRRRPEDEVEGEEEEEGASGGRQYYRVRSSWFTFMPDHDVIGPFSEEPVVVDVRKEKVALEIAMEEEAAGVAAAPQRPPGLASVLEFEERKQYFSARIFATSLNCGGVVRLASLGCIEEWVPKDGYDLYVLVWRGWHSYVVVFVLGGYLLTSPFDHSILQLRDRVAGVPPAWAPPPRHPLPSRYERLRI